MVTVQLRDAANPEKVLLDSIALPFEPRLDVPMYVWDYFKDRKIGFFTKRYERCFVITQVLQYEISIKEPDRSGIVYLAKEVRP
jgi:hypothetical protein